MSSLPITPKSMSPVGFNVLAWSVIISEKLSPLAERLKTIDYNGIECFMVGIGIAYGTTGMIEMQMVQ